MKANCLKGLSFTALYHGQAIACAGIRPLWPGVAEAWLLFGPEVKNHRIFIVKSIKQYLSDLIIKYNLWRLQAYCRTDFPEAINFLYHLGFRVEGKARRYNPDGTDAYFMSIITEAN
jgi:RimJ/RimL family protein N-acetyltransferase